MRNGLKANCTCLWFPLSVCRCGETKAAPGENVYNTLKPILLEKEKAENALKVTRRVF